MTNQEMDAIGRVLEASIQGKYVDYKIEYIPSKKVNDMIRFGYYVKAYYKIGITIEDLYDEFLKDNI